MSKMHTGTGIRKMHTYPDIILEMKSLQICVPDAYGFEQVFGILNSTTTYQYPESILLIVKSPKVDFSKPIGNIPKITKKEVITSRIWKN